MLKSDKGERGRDLGFWKCLLGEREDDPDPKLSNPETPHPDTEGMSRLLTKAIMGPPWDNGSGSE